MKNAAPTPALVITTLSIIDPPELGGRRHVLGKLVTTRWPWLTWILGAPFRRHFDYNRRRHNERMSSLGFEPK